MWNLPNTVWVLDREYKIRDDGDYRTILNIILTHNAEDMNETERALAMLCMFYDGLDDPDDVFNEFDTQEYLSEASNQISVFIACGDMDDDKGIKTSYPLIDWKSDELIIAAGINPQLGNGLDVRYVEYMHWWTFWSYFLGIQEGILSTVVGIRDKIVKNKKKEKWEQDFIKNNPQYFKWRQRLRTVEEKQLEKDIFDLWNRK